jgi:hypothetical protein
MWYSYVVPGSIAFVLNTFAVLLMFFTKKEWNLAVDRNTWFVLPYCGHSLYYCWRQWIRFINYFCVANFSVLVIVAMMNGVIGTMPSLFLFDGLPCACKTEDCFDTTALCTLNRLSIPSLQV